MLKYIKNYGFRHALTTFGITDENFFSNLFKGCGFDVTFAISSNCPHDLFLTNKLQYGNL